MIETGTRIFPSVREGLNSEKITYTRNPARTQKPECRRRKGGGVAMPKRRERENDALPRGRAQGFIGAHRTPGTSHRIRPISGQYQSRSAVSTTNSTAMSQKPILRKWRPLK